jgi:coenzyme F420-reducing hydrogenase delta subunit/ferredoxin
MPPNPPAEDALAPGAPATAHPDPGRRPALAAGAWSLLRRADAGMNRLYGSRLNPFYHSGALVVVLWLVLLVTGIYLLLFYRVGAPYASVERITEQVWLGRWIRSLHRYATDAAVVVTAVHALRMFAQGRSWGPRTLAWVSGLVLVFVFLVCGWTGYVMIWDVQAQVLAVEGARIMDALPILSEPLGRTFVGEGPVPSAFFFTNLFLHVALPIGLGLLLWLHVARVSRPVLLPPRPLLWGSVGLLLAVSLLWPIGMAPEADLFRLPPRGEYDFFLSFWLPLTQALSPAGVWLAVLLLTGVAVLAPWWTRPRAAGRRPASRVDERVCTGCVQCSLDCPYEAITMVQLAGDRPRSVARVDPALCVSCGICAGSCAPMAVGPPGRTGRDQLNATRRFVASHRPGGGEVVVLACTRGAGGITAQPSLEGHPVLPIECTGSLHTSVIEALVRGGAGGVMVVACPARDCWNREGAKWAEQRMFHEREAELQARVDRRRVRLVEAGAAERDLLVAHLRAFQRELPPAPPGGGDPAAELAALCERAEREVGR